jgi:hypothetical protein
VGPDMTAMNWVPLVAAGAVGMIGMTFMILRSMKDEGAIICEGRAQREAAETLDRARPMGGAAEHRTSVHH